MGEDTVSWRGQQENGWELETLAELHICVTSDDAGSNLP